MHAALYASPSLIQFSERIHEIRQKIKFIVFLKTMKLFSQKIPVERQRGTMSVDWLADARVNGQPATEYNVIKRWLHYLSNELQTQVEVLR
jgi:hypothetical protein